MNNPRLATRYAKSLLDLAVEQNRLDAVYADARFLQTIIKSNPDLVALLRSPVVTADKKLHILQSLVTGRVDELTFLFIRLLVQKTREENLPEIVSAFITQYNTLKGIHRVRLTTAVPVGEDTARVLVDQVRKSAGIQHIELESVVDDSIIGGFKLEVGDQLVDASVLRDLNDVKRQFKDNQYIQHLR